MSVLSILLIFYVMDTISSIECRPSHQRNGINVYKWNQIKESQCAYPMNVPSIIIESTLKDWAKSTRKRILKLFKKQDNFVNLERHLSDCSCFDSTNSSLCRKYVNSFSSYTSSMESLFGDHVHSIWYKHQKNYDSNQKYLQCVDKQIVTIPIKTAIKMSKVSKTSQNKMSAVSYPMPLKLASNERSNYVQYIKYSHLKPYFEVFGMKKGMFDIDMMNVWIGSTNYESTLHFDKSNNAYFMLSGNKTFLLSQPNKYDQFVLFPQLHTKVGNAFYDNESIEHMYMAVHIKQNEILYLPSFWFHHVVNGKYNSFALNIWMENYLAKSIENYQFSHAIKVKLLDVANHFDEILYFIQRLEEKFFGQGASDALLFGFFSRLYPVLNEIKHYHLKLSDDDSLNWIVWFIDFENMLKCCSNKKYQNILHLLLKDRERLFVCKLAVDIYDDEWNNVIDELVHILNALQVEQGDGVPQIQLAEFIEKMLYLIFDDVMFVPIFSALHFV